MKKKSERLYKLPQNEESFETGQRSSECYHITIIINFNDFVLAKHSASARNERKK